MLGWQVSVAAVGPVAPSTTVKEQVARPWMAYFACRVIASALVCPTSLGGVAEFAASIRDPFAMAFVEVWTGRRCFCFHFF